MTKKEVLEKLKRGELHCFFRFVGFGYYGHKQYSICVSEHFNPDLENSPIFEAKIPGCFLENMNLRDIAILELEWAIELDRDVEQFNDLPF